MLSDKTPRTRLPAVSFLKDVLQDPQAATVFVPGLRQFLERFRPRLIDIAQHDADRKCREEAAEVVVEGAILGVLGEEDETEAALLPMIFNENEVIRKAASRFFVHTWKAASEELVGEGTDNVAKTQGQLKAFAQLISQAAKSADIRSDETVLSPQQATMLGEAAAFYKREIQNLGSSKIDGLDRMADAFEDLVEADEWADEVLTVRQRLFFGRGNRCFGNTI